MRLRYKTKMRPIPSLAAVLLCAAGCSDVFVDVVVRPGDRDTATENQPDTASDPTDEGGRQLDRLGRGMVAVATSDNGIYVGWRLLASDPPDIAFNLYRDNVRINETPIRDTTDFIDANALIGARYFVRSIINNAESDQSEPVTVLSEPYRRIPISGTLSVYRAGVGDLDGDREYDYVLIRPIYTGVPQPGPNPTTFKIEGYRLGAQLWQIDLGPNIELGETHGPTVVYDLDGDGISEIIAKTAEGTVDGTGTRIGDVNSDGITDYRDETGAVKSGPEFLSVFSGLNGAELARADWIPRGEGSDWGSATLPELPNHNFMGIAYLDGVHPSIVIVRGIAARQDVWAFDYEQHVLTPRWKWSSLNEAGFEYLSQGYHGMRVGDIDGDGRDEILPGSYALDDTGRALWSARDEHGDTSMLTQIDPTTDGLELWYTQGWGSISIYDDKPPPPVALRDAATGVLIAGPTEETSLRVNYRTLAADIDPNHTGMEMWSTLGNLYDSRGVYLGDSPDTCDFAVYWDGDPLRELLDIGISGYTNLLKWNYGQQILDTLQVFEGDLVGFADLFGDWREEVITYLPGEIRIYTTITPADRRIVTLMHDPLYRLSVVTETMGLLQATETGFFIGAGMADL